MAGNDLLLIGKGAENGPARVGGNRAHGAPALRACVLSLKQWVRGPENQNHSSTREHPGLSSLLRLLWRQTRCLGPSFFPLFFSRALSRRMTPREKELHHAAGNSITQRMLSCAALQRCQPAFPQARILEVFMKLSARNVLKGKITEVHKGATTTHVLIDIGGGSTVVSSITNEAADDMKLDKGQPAAAVIKASDVMVSID
jgi:molybdopterin-binding protein